jgi:hypothetical protein
VTFCVIGLVYHLSCIMPDACCFGYDCSMIVAAGCGEVAFRTSQRTGSGHTKNINGLIKNLI